MSRYSLVICSHRSHKIQVTNSSAFLKLKIRLLSARIDASVVRYCRSFSANSFYRDQPGMNQSIEHLAKSCSNSYAR